MFGVHAGTVRRISGVRRDPIPYLVALATSCNIGSAATIIGNPQNMYIGVAGELAFARFTLVMLPIVLVALGLCWATVILVWPAAFVDGIRPPLAEPTAIVEHEASFDRAVVYKTLAILIALVAAFVVLPAGDRVVAALVGGGLLMISRRRDSAPLPAGRLGSAFALFRLVCRQRRDEAIRPDGRDDAQRREHRHRSAQSAHARRRDNSAQQHRQQRPGGPSAAAFDPTTLDQRRGTSSPWRVPGRAI